MKKRPKTISSPDELDKHLQYTSPVTWIVLGAITAVLISFFVWSMVYKIAIKITGTALISNNEVTLNVDKSSRSQLAVGQKVYIVDKAGEILSFKDDGSPVVSSMELSDGEYVYTVVIKEMKPFDFVIGK